jgi:hypothetical protein
MNTEENGPVLEFIAVLIVVVGIGKRIIDRAPIWIDAFGHFVASIWPTIFAVLISLSALVLLYLGSKRAMKKWREHQKYICDLNDKILGLREDHRSKDTRIMNLARELAKKKDRIARLENGLSRYHKLLVRNVSPPQASPKETHQEVKKALASVLQDFGGPSGAFGKGVGR